MRRNAAGHSANGLFLFIIFHMILKALFLKIIRSLRVIASTELETFFLSCHLFSVVDDYDNWGPLAVSRFSFLLSPRILCILGQCAEKEKEKKNEKKKKTKRNRTRDKCIFIVWINSGL